MAKSTSQSLRARSWLGKRFYDIPEVESAMEAMRQSVDDTQKNAQDEAARLYDANQSLQDEINQLHAALQAQTDEYEQLSVIEQDNYELLSQTQAELEKVQTERQQEATANAAELAAMRREIDQLKQRTQILTRYLEQEKQSVKEYERMVSDDSVGRANDKARKIVSDAMSESDRIMNEVVDQRTRVIAASRSMYYNALQFKMSLSERFSAMEKDLDRAIDLLRILETTPFSGDKITEGMESDEPRDVP